MGSTSHTPSACVTVDLDTLACYRDIHGLDYDMVGQEGDPTYTVGLRRLLDLLEEMSIPATLFVIGRDTVVPVHHELLQEAFDEGHELANHTYSHHYDLSERPHSEQRTELARGEGAIASVTGRSPVGFRAPGYNVTEDLLELCRSRDYRYDSSLLPSPPYYTAKMLIMAWQQLSGRPSRSAKTPYENLFAPITSYRPDPEALWRRADVPDGLVEVPMCLLPGLRVPVIGTSLHLIGAGGFDCLYPILRRTYRDIFNLEFHAIDFIDREDVPDGEQLAEHQPDLNVPWTQKRQRYVRILNRLREDYVFRRMDDAVERMETRA
jgi:hypothetical protein